MKTLVGVIFVCALAGGSLRADPSKALANVNSAVSPLIFCDGKTMISCKICQQEFVTFKGLGLHVHRKHKILPQSYYNTYLRKSKEEGQCLGCGAPTKFITLTYGYNRFCCLSCFCHNSDFAKRTFKKGHISWNKSIPWSEDVRAKMSVAHTGVKLPMERCIRQSLRLQGTHHNIASKRKMREIAIRRREQQANNGEPLMPTIGHQERLFLNKLESSIPYVIVRQYKVCGYYLDGYISEVNIAIEFDELVHHTSSSAKIYDKQKQAEICEELNCIYFRVSDAQWNKDPNSIIQQFLLYITKVPPSELYI